MSVAVVTSVIRAWSPPDISTNRSRTPAPQHRSSPPPMMKSRPLGLPSLTCGKLPRVIHGEPRARRLARRGVPGECGMWVECQRRQKYVGGVPTTTVGRGGSPVQPASGPSRRPRRRTTGGLASSSGMRSNGFVALSTTSVAISRTRRPWARATDLSSSNACRGRSRCRSASTPMACSTRTRAVSACSSWATVCLSLPGSGASLPSGLAACPLTVGMACVGRSAASRSARTMALVRSETSSSPTRQPVAVRRATGAWSAGKPAPRAGPAPVLRAWPSGAGAACLPALPSCCHPGSSCPAAPPGGAAAVLGFRSRACQARTPRVCRIAFHGPSVSR